MALWSKLISFLMKTAKVLRTLTQHWQNIDTANIDTDGFLSVLLRYSGRQSSGNGIEEGNGYRLSFLKNKHTVMFRHIKSPAAACDIICIKFPDEDCAEMSQLRSCCLKRGIRRCHNRFGDPVALTEKKDSQIHTVLDAPSLFQAVSNIS